MGRVLGVKSDSNLDFSHREFPMTDRNFSDICKFAYNHTGIKLSDHKKNMIYGRLARRLRKLNMDNFDDYCQLIKSENVAELPEFINAITTNLTSFFREQHHFTYLSDTIIPELCQRNKHNRRIRIWSAGCSTGQEPYSLAMVLSKDLRIKNWDVKILATDLDSNVLETGKNGIYSLESIESIPQKYQNSAVVNKKSEKIKIKDSVARYITFKQLNLMSDWPMRGKFDVIFCRNVVIYFDIDVQRQLFSRYFNIINDNGYLIIGHSESLHNVSRDFKNLGKTVYQKIVQ